MIARLHHTPLALLGALSLSTLAVADPPLEQPGDITAVTVYRGQALVTRTLEIPSGAGLREIIVTDLPAHIIPGSLYAESSPGLEVRSLTYRERPVSDDVRDEVQTIDAKIADVRQRLQANRAQREVLVRQSAYLDRVEDFTSSTSASDLNKGVLDANVIKELSSYLFEQRQRIAEQMLNFDQQHESLAAQLELLNRERGQITDSSSRTAREAVLLADVTGNADGRVTVHYLVDQANWSPSYTARMDSAQGDMQLVYHASIEQRSGEPWENVSVTLSTATPSLTARAPRLEQLSLSLTQMNQPIQLGSTIVAEQFKDLRQRQADVDQSRNYAAAPMPANALGKRIDGMDAPLQAGQSGDVLAIVDRQLNEIAERIQVLEYCAPGESIMTQTRSVQPTSESLAVSYTLPSRISLASRTGQQLVTVRKITLDAEPYRLATPVLTEFIYHEAAVRNTSDIVLLAGPLASYRDGQFVGHSELPSIAAGEAFTVGFGVDSSLRAHRDILNIDEQIQGGNRVVEITYALHLDNFNGGNVPVRLFDRMPTADDDEQIRITLVSTSQSLSDDERYRDSLHDQGILRWDVNIPSGGDAAGTIIVNYTLRLEYDKQMTLASDETDRPAG